MAPSKRLTAALVAALILVSGAAADGGRKLMQTSLVPCQTYMGAAVTSTSQTVFNSAFTSAFEKCFKSFCDQPVCSMTCAGQTYIPTSSVIATAIAEAEPALASSTATASLQAVSIGFVAGDCSGYKSTVSASGKAQTIARALSASWAKAIANVVGDQAYSNVAAKVAVEQEALQAACYTDLVDINNSKLKCYKKKNDAGQFIPCNSWTWTGAALTRYNNLSTLQKNKCFVLQCSFADPADSVTTVVSTSAQAIAEAVGIVTITANAGKNTGCTYDGNKRTCNEFVNLCGAVCVDGLECGDPDVVNYCSTDEGDWAELPNGDYQCQPICEGSSLTMDTVVSVCRDGTCDATGCGTQICEWACAGGLIKTAYKGYFETQTLTQPGVPVEVTSVSVATNSVGNERTIVWTGKIVAPTTDTYLFRTTSDDASIVTIDDVVVVDNGGLHIAETVTSAPIELEGNRLYTIKVTYGNNFGLSTMVMEWKKASASTWQSDLTPLLLL